VIQRSEPELLHCTLAQVTMSGRWSHNWYLRATSTWDAAGL